MSKKPKKPKPSEADKVNASVAIAEYNNFKQKYDPLLQKMRNESLTEDTTSMLRSRSNADTMQALTDNLSLQGSQRIDAGADMAQATQGQLGQATLKGTQLKNRMQSSVLGTARGQAADAQRGMANASRLATSEALAKAKAKQDVSQAKFKAGVQLGTAFVAQGLDNMNTRGGTDGQQKGTFFTPVRSDGQSVGGPLDRLDYTGTFLKR